MHHALECRAFTTERLRALGVVPDVGELQLALDFGQAFFLDCVVKDTSEGLRCGSTYP